MRRGPYQDSTGRLIEHGDRILFRTKVYTIRAFLDGQGRHGTAAIDVEEELHTEEVPDEISVDLIDEKEGP